MADISGWALAIGIIGAGTGLIGGATGIVGAVTAVRGRKDTQEAIATSKHALEESLVAPTRKVHVDRLLALPAKCNELERQLKELTRAVQRIDEPEQIDVLWQSIRDLTTEIAGQQIADEDLMSRSQVLLRAVSVYDDTTNPFLNPLTNAAYTFVQVLLERQSARRLGHQEEQIMMRLGSAKDQVNEAMGRVDLALEQLRERIKFLDANGLGYMAKPETQEGKPI